MYEVVIVGGGIHGVHLAVMLQAQAGVSRERIRVIDPHPELMQRWSTTTGNTGMMCLRSPVVHHVDAEPMSLLHYARKAGKADAFFVHPYQRPGYALFQAHSREVIHRWGIASLHERVSVTGLTRRGSSWRVHTSGGELFAKRVVLAIGPSSGLHWPDWAAPLRSTGRVHHVFEPTFDRSRLPGGHVVVVGGGISAAHLALTLAAERPGAITLLARHPFRVHLFDSDPVWLGPLGRQQFARVAQPERRDFLKSVRHRGSLPPEVEKKIRAFRGVGALQVVEANVQQARSAEGGIELETCCAPLPRAASVILATGFDAARPGSDWLPNTIAEERLPVAHCGFPLLPPSLEWAPGLFVSGALAELELGPPARNISGARIAARSIAHLV